MGDGFGVHRIDTVYRNKAKYLYMLFIKEGGERREPGCLPFTKTIRLEISGVNIEQLNTTSRERELL